MSADPWPEGVARRILETVDSTNAEAARMAPAASGPVWVLARRQTAGRGRRGRAWTDPEGNFAATVLMRPAEPPERLALRSFVAALALHEALVALTGRAEAFALKWPNDVLLNGGKLAGILPETIATPGALHLAVGIGVNLLHAPAPEPGAVAPVDLLSATGVALEPEELLDHLAPAFARWEDRLRSFGFAPLRDAFLRHAARLGQPIIARTVTETHEGTFEGIDDRGALVLTTARGLIAVSAADVFLNPVQTPEARPCS
ncbi:MAG: biotin--[acetyl-CoA-carboxylase] ligase [Rhodobacteraceae bacterium]|nr:biotin--[acetyl-CoA-carboxylase] ligase [Paracoccaceae bacterium]